MYPEAVVRPADILLSWSHILPKPEAEGRQKCRFPYMVVFVDRERLPAPNLTCEVEGRAGLLRVLGGQQGLLPGGHLHMLGCALAPPLD